MKQSFTLLLLLLFVSYLPKTYSQDILWEKSIGGIYSEYLYDIQPTPDYGFVLAGSSLSQNDQAEQGSLDYFIWKMDEVGNKQWQQSFGGQGTDHLYSINLTKDGGYILGGSSDSESSEDKKYSGNGMDDFWIIKLNPNGEVEWEQTIGGAGTDILLSITQTQDGGYILGGTSDSPVGQISPMLPKKENQEESIPSHQIKQQAFGNTDFFVVKLTPEGLIEWSNTYGGKYMEVLRSIHPTKQGYMLGGYSNSPASGNKSAEHIGYGDYWLVSIDTQGNLLWDKSYGGKEDDQLYSLQPTEDGGWIAGGNSNSSTHQDKRASNGEGTDFWILKLDQNGAPLWDKTLDFGQWDVLTNIIPTKDQHYLLAGYSQNQRGEDYIAIKLSQTGETLWQTSIGGKETDQLQKTIRSRDGGYILAGTSNSGKGKNKNQSTNGLFDFWVIKLQDNNQPIQAKQQLVEVYPNPTKQYSNILIHQAYKQASAQLYSTDGKFLQQLTLKGANNTVDLANVPKGVYILKIYFDAQAVDVKVIKN